MIVLIVLTSMLAFPPYATAQKQLVYVLVDQRIQQDIIFHLDRWEIDIENIGFRVTIVPIDCSECTPANIRAIFIDAYSEGLVGSLLIGNIPVATYEDLTDDETLPIDLFYADLNGTWVDIDSNGNYDQHTGHRAPEIWIGRLHASDVSENEISLYQRYFDRNHAYRTGNWSLADEALIYIDDPWIGSSDDTDYYVSRLYKDRVLIDEPNTTSAQDYLERLATQNWSLVHIKTHGNYTHHALKANSQWTWISNEDIRSVNPRALFYNLFSCESCCFSEPDYIGGCYLFSSYGLAVIGPTDKGGMLFCSDFYSNLNNNTLGFSFKAWLTERMAEEDEGHWYSRDWFYGMVMLGDPTLLILQDAEKPTVTLLGDVNGDKRVDAIDLAVIALIFGSRRGDLAYDASCDFNQDNQIDIIDLVVVAHLYGTEYS